jgi:hypothetical protein
MNIKSIENMLDLPLKRLTFSEEEVLCVDRDDNQVGLCVLFFDPNGNNCTYSILYLLKFEFEFNSQHTSI